MTEYQKAIRMYIAKRFHLTHITLRNIDKDIVEVTDRAGDSMRFAINCYGDILDADTNAIIADSNTSHDAGAKFTMPTDWTERHEYFCQ